MASSVTPQLAKPAAAPIQVNCLLSPKVVAGIDKMATQARMTRSVYASALLNAAYTARCTGSDDIELDTAVGRVALLIGAGLDVTAIADVLEFAPETVQRIHDAWIAELCGRDDRNV